MQEANTLSRDAATHTTEELQTSFQRQNVDQMPTCKPEAKRPLPSLVFGGPDLFVLADEIQRLNAVGAG